MPLRLMFELPPVPFGLSRSRTGFVVVEPPAFCTAGVDRAELPLPWRTAASNRGGVGDNLDSTCDSPRPPSTRSPGGLGGARLSTMSGATRPPRLARANSSGLAWTIPDPAPVISGHLPESFLVSFIAPRATIGRVRDTLLTEVRDGRPASPAQLRRMRPREAPQQPRLTIRSIVTAGSAAVRCARSWISTKVRVAVSGLLNRADDQGAECRRHTDRRPAEEAGACRPRLAAIACPAHRAATARVETAEIR